MEFVMKRSRENVAQLKELIALVSVQMSGQMIDQFGFANRDEMLSQRAVGGGRLAIRRRIGKVWSHQSAQVFGAIWGRIVLERRGGPKIS